MEAAVSVGWYHSPSVDPEEVHSEEGRRELEELYEHLGRPVPQSRRWWEQDDDASAPAAAELVTLARRFHRQLRVLLNESMEGTGISYAQFEVLEIVHNDRNHHAGSIAGALGITRQSANELVRKLEAAGYVERLTPDNGVRGVLITAAGEAQFQRCNRAIEPFRTFFGRMTADERRGLKDALHAARAALRPPAPW